MDIGNVRSDLPRLHPRRAVLQGAVGATTTIVAGAILAACGESAVPTIVAAPAGGSSPATAGSPPATTALAPTSAAAMRAPVMGTPAATGVVAADGHIPSPAPNVPDGYTKLPPPFKSVKMTPGKGDKVTSIIPTTSPPIVPHDQNQYWQGLEQRMGIQWDATVVPMSAYEEKFTALVASNDLPDLVYLTPPPGTGKLIQQRAFTDLTPYVGGEAVKEYPNLALYDPKIWANASYDKKIYGVPRPRYVMGNVLLFRQDWAQKIGISQPKNADDFFNLLVAFTRNDPDGNGKPDTFGLTTNSPRPDFAIPFFYQMYRGVNKWRLNSDGSLTRDLETDEYKQAVDFARRLWAAGAYHPDAATMTINQAQDAFVASKIGGYMDDYSMAGWGDRTRVAGRILMLTPSANPVALIPFGADGGKGTYFPVPGSVAFCAMPARIGKDKACVKELLRVLDYLAAPFGSEEYRYIQFGTEGVHSSVRADGALVRNDRGEAEKNNLPNLTSSLRPFYYPDVSGPEPILFMQRMFKEHLAIGIDDPTTGLYSPTNEAKNAELSQMQADRTLAIVTGREALVSWDQCVKDWRSRGGDQIRTEYQDALKA